MKRMNPMMTKLQLLTEHSTELDTGHRGQCVYTDTLAHRYLLENARTTHIVRKLLERRPSRFSSCMYTSVHCGDALNTPSSFQLLFRNYMLFQMYLASAACMTVSFPCVS